MFLSVWPDWFALMALQGATDTNAMSSSQHCNCNSNLVCKNSDVAIAIQEGFTIETHKHIYTSILVYV